jgi:hypothetical protein
MGFFPFAASREETLQSNRYATALAGGSLHSTCESEVWAGSEGQRQKVVPLDDEPANYALEFADIPRP